MNEIVSKETLGPDVVRMDVRHEKLARKARPGQFVILRIAEEGERFPLTIADSDPEAGTITLIFAVVGRSTVMLANMEPGDEILDLVGPLGLPSEIETFGSTLCVGGGIGAAPLYPIAKALKEAGNEVTAVLGARTEDLLILEGEFKAFADEVHVATDDGSYGREGFVTDVIQDLLEEGRTFDHAWTIGPVPMMRATCGVTAEADIPTVVSLNPIMVDGTGMCGGCRVIVGDEVKFACVDGPEFDGHEVDFESLGKRLTAYKTQERRHHEACKIGLDTPTEEDTPADE